MTVQQQLFIDAYFLSNCNATRAAASAGYSQPNVRGSQLVKNPQVAAELKRRLDENAMTANEVLSRLGDMARGSLEDFIDLGEHHPDYPQALQGRWSLDLHKAQRLGKMPLLKSIKSGEFGPEIVLHDAQLALATLARHHKLLTDKIEHDFTKLSDADLIAAAKGALDGGGEARADADAAGSVAPEGLPPAA